MTADALLITGTVGVGKTTVAETVGQLLARRGVPHVRIKRGSTPADQRQILAVLAAISDC